MYISQLIRFARVLSHVEYVNARNKCLTAKLFIQGYRYHKLRKFFFQVLSPTLYNDFEIQCRIKIPLKSGPIGTRIYGDLVYNFKKIMSRTVKYHVTVCMQSN